MPRPYVFTCSAWHATSCDIILVSEGEGGETQTTSLGRVSMRRMNTLTLSELNQSNSYTLRLESCINDQGQSLNPLPNFLPLPVPPTGPQHLQSLGHVVLHHQPQPHSPSQPQFQPQPNPQKPLQLSMYGAGAMVPLLGLLLLPLVLQLRKNWPIHKSIGGTGARAAADALPDTNNKRHEYRDEAELAMPYVEEQVLSPVHKKKFTSRTFLLGETTGAELPQNEKDWRGFFDSIYDTPDSSTAEAPTGSELCK
ncbi:unnamed protein product [Chrysoparadoxa australica]